MKGVQLRTLKTLNFFPAICWYDYRFGYAFSPVDSTRITRINDLSPNAYNLRQPVASRGILYDDDFGFKNGNVGSTLTNLNGGGNFYPLLNKLHNGNGYGVYWIGKVFNDGGDDTIQFTPIDTGAMTSASGYQMRFLFADMAVRITNFDSTGTTRYNANSADDVLPNDTVFLLKNIYYGDGVSNNILVRLGSNNIITATTAKTASTANYQHFRFMVRQASTSGLVYNKLTYIVDFSGLSVAQINQMDAEIISTIKSDVEYASLAA